MYMTYHSKQRFLERVNCNGLPKKNKDKFIENYIKKAYKNGLLPEQISDAYLRKYMYTRLNSNIHNSKITKITHYKNNLFLFNRNKCVTILSVPEEALNSVDNSIYITKLSSYIKAINERKSVKQWLCKYGNFLENTKEIKRCIVDYPKDLSYKYLMDEFPLRAIVYIKNDAKFRKSIRHIIKHRHDKYKFFYKFIYTLLLLIPKNQIIPLQQLLKNENKSIFNYINNVKITQRQINVAYKQLFILLGGNLVPKYKSFKADTVSDSKMIHDYLNMIFDSYLAEVNRIIKMT